MKSHILYLMLVIFMAFSYTGCSSDDGGSSTTPTTTIPTTPTDPDLPIVTTPTGITGTVTDMEGTALANVSIYTKDFQTKTDENGVYTLTIEADANVSITAHLSNYAKNSKVVDIVDGLYTTQDIKLAPVDTIESFDVANGASIKAKEAVIDLPVGSYTLDDGTAYTGEVTVKATYNRATTIDGSDAFPGEFLGETTEGDTKVLQSYGFIDVTLESDSGANINLGEDKTATLTYPMDPNIEETPATIPLWYFDTDKGIWIEDGVANYDATTNTYVGSVTHFSTWNLDAKFDGAVLKGCVEDALGNPLPLANLSLSSPGWNNSSDHQIMNNDTTGEFTLINAPSNVVMSIQAELNGLVSQEQNVTLLPNTTTTMSDCLVVNVDATALFITASMRLLDNDANPLPNQYVNVLNPDDNSYLSDQATDENGTISINFQKKAITKIQVSTFYQGINFKKIFEIDTTNKSIKLGDFILATTTYNGCVTLEDGSSTTPEGNTTLSDGITTVDDGTVISDDGLTTFGSDTRVLSTNTAYEDINNYSSNIAFDLDGSFSIVVQRDNLAHNLYAHTYTTDDPNNYEAEKNFNLTGLTTFNALSNNITRTNVDQCIKLHKMSNTTGHAKAYLETTNNDVHIEVQFSQSDSNWGTEIVTADAKLKSATFDINKNGVYIIKQIVNNYNTDTILNGKMKVEVNGKKYEITIPDPDTVQSFQGETLQSWIAFGIEVYDGTVTVKEINSLW